MYVLFLDHFQGTSYGNETFSSLVMVPLAQKYDIKWRKMVWSEHAIALRFISCREDQVLYLSIYESIELCNVLYIFSVLDHL